MANKDMGRKNRNESRDDFMDREDFIRGHGDEMEDASNETEEFDDIDGDNEQDDEDREGSF